METKIRDFNEFKIELQTIKDFIGPHLSEPYTIFTYYYFCTYYPHLTFTITDPEDNLLGILVGRTEEYEPKENMYEEPQMEDEDVKCKKAYIAMLVDDPKLRRQGYGRKLISLFIDEVIYMLFDFMRTERVFIYIRGQVWVSISLEIEQ